MAEYIVTHSDSLEPYITQARKAYNDGIPQKTITLAVPEGSPEGTEPEVVPNPELLNTNAEYIALVHARAVASWEKQYADKIRLPVGKWLARWTDDEINAVRYVLAPNDAQVKAWLLELDRNEYVNFTYPTTVIGVPAVCATLEQLGVIAAGQAQARAEQLLAFP